MSGILSALIGSFAAAKPTPPSYDSIATVNGNGSTGTITFSSIPSTYSHLEVRASFLASSANDDLLVRLNGDTASNYSFHELRGSGTTVITSRTAPQAYMVAAGNAGNTTYPSSFVLSFYEYKNTNINKTIRVLSGQDRNGDGSVSLFSGNWRNTAAVNSITLYAPSSVFNTGSKFALYGIKG
jgi:hypothetical protein